MPRILTSNSLAKWSSIFLSDHLEIHSICSAAGAIYVKNTFTQVDGTVTIQDSFAENTGGAVHLSGEFRDVASAGFEAVVGSF